MATRPAAKVSEPNDWKTVEPSDWQSVPDDYETAPGVNPPGGRFIEGFLNTTVRPVLNVIQHPLSTLGGLARLGLPGGAERAGADMAQPIGEDIATGNYAGAGGQVAGLVAPFALKGLGSLIPDEVAAGARGALRGGYAAAKDIPLVGKIIRIPGAMVKGYQEAVNPTPIAPEPFRINPVTAARMGRALPSDPDLPTGNTIPRGRFIPPDEPQSAAPKPFRANPVIARRMGGKQLFEEDLPSPSRVEPPPPAGARLPGVKKYEIQHFGDLRLPRNQPRPLPSPKMYDSAGRLIR